jgi:hypothetical protein
MTYYAITITDFNYLLIISFLYDPIKVDFVKKCTRRQLDARLAPIDAIGIRPGDN